MTLTFHSQTHDVNRFGTSWVAGNRQCRALPRADPCAAGTTRSNAAKSQCYVLLNELGERYFVLLMNLKTTFTCLTFKT